MPDDQLKRAYGASEFHWAVGIEDTFIPQSKPNLRALDEYELTQHYEMWRDDIARAADSGATMIRWGVPWYRVEKQQGVYDWTWTDQVINHIRSVGLDPIIDLVHYGTPLWLEKSFDDARYPELVSAFARAFINRYKHQIRYYTPLNEPTVNADFSGRRAEWPPYLAGDKGYIRVLLQCARGIQATVSTLRQLQPAATIFAVEAMQHHEAESSAAEVAMNREYAQDMLSYDLCTGSVDDKHVLYDWLLQNGATAAELELLRKNKISFDVYGVNFYPWSSNRVVVGKDKVVTHAAGCADGRLLIDIFHRVHSRTNLPLFVTETSAAGYRATSWMSEVWDAVRLARMDGIPVIGYTWFPLITMIEWDYRQSKKIIGEHLLDLGLIQGRFEGGKLVRTNLPLFEQYHDLTRRRLPPIAVASPRAKDVVYSNPVWNGYMADPFVRKFGNTYFAYGTADRQSDGNYFPVLTSTDLVDWHYVGGALQPLQDEKAVAYWAPEVAENNGKYYLYYSAGGGAGEHHQIRVATASRPQGPFIDTGKILVPQEAFNIDPHPFKDPATGKWHLFFAKDFFDGRAGTGLAMIGLNDDMVSTNGEIQTVARASADWQIFERNRDWYGKRWDAWHTLEGPTVLVHQERYYCLYSGGCWNTKNYGVGFAHADSINGPWIDDQDAQGASVLSAVPDHVLGPGHNSVVIAPDGKTDVIVYHAWDPAWTARKLCVDRLTWTATGPRCLPTWQDAVLYERTE